MTNHRQKLVLTFILSLLFLGLSYLLEGLPLAFITTNQSCLYAVDLNNTCPVNQLVWLNVGLDFIFWWVLTYFCIYTIHHVRKHRAKMSAS